jgi:hypothetical protein
VPKLLNFTNGFLITCLAKNLMKTPILCKY